MRSPLFAPVALAAALLAGCGAEVSGTAATAAKLQAEQAEQAKAQKEKLQKDLGAALQAGQDAASAAAR